jgi:hypothetical protein
MFLLGQLVIIEAARTLSSTAWGGGGSEADGGGTAELRHFKPIWSAEHKRRIFWL